MYMTKEDITTLNGHTKARPFKSADVPELLPALTVLFHPDYRRIGDHVLLDELSAGEEEYLSRSQPIFYTPTMVTGPLADPSVSRMPLRFYLRGNRLILERNESRSIVRVGSRPLLTSMAFTRRDLMAGAMLCLGERVLLWLHLQVPASRGWTVNHGLIGNSREMVKLREHIGSVADLELPVLLRGETGTGKDLVARAIHQASKRTGPFVAVNMGSLSPHLASGELFGHLRGAFTGADRTREGFFQKARGGTLFLDEIGEAVAETQIALLRTLETGEVMPLGARTGQKTDIRVIAATDADLDAMIGDQRFRAPLFYRLAGFEVSLPPLRERRDDIPRLFFHFLKKELAALGRSGRLAPTEPGRQPWLPLTVVEGFCRYHWPGNVRELCNVVRQLAVINRDKDHFCLDERTIGLIQSSTGPVFDKTMSPCEPPSTVEDRKPKDIKTEELIAALAENGWSQSAAGRQLGVSRSTLYDLMRAAGLKFAVDLTPEEIQTAYDECNGDLSLMVPWLKVSLWGLKRRLKEIGLVPSKRG